MSHPLIAVAMTMLLCSACAGHFSDPVTRPPAEPCAIENASKTIRHARWYVERAIPEFDDTPIAKENLTRIREALVEIGGEYQPSDVSFEVLAPCPPEMLTKQKAQP